MVKQKRILLAILFLLIHYTTAFCQKLSFDITLSGNKVGAMTVEQKDSGDFKVYNVKSNTEAKVLFSKRKSDMTMHVVFDRNGNMVYSYYKNIKTDGDILTTAVLQNGKLNVIHNGDKLVLDGLFNASSVVLYFTEPQKLQRIFSERAGHFFDLVKQDDGSYQASMDDGTAKFSYTNRKLTQIEVSKGILGTVVIKPAQ